MSRIEFTVECTARLRWWARALFFFVRLLLRFVGFLASIASNHGIETRFR